MLGLSSLGFIHTLISLVALVSGLWALIRDRQISLQTYLGQTYALTTFLTAITALFIFQRGGFGPGHAMALATLLALAVWYVATYTDKAGPWARHLRVLTSTSTLLFHFLAGATETLTRVPPGEPLLPDPAAPQFLFIFAGLFAVCAVLVLWQLRAQRQ